MLLPQALGGTPWISTAKNIIGPQEQGEIVSSARRAEIQRLIIKEQTGIPHR